MLPNKEIIEDITDDDKKQNNIRLVRSQRNRNNEEATMKRIKTITTARFCDNNTVPYSTKNKIKKNNNKIDKLETIKSNCDDGNHSNDKSKTTVRPVQNSTAAVKSSDILLCSIPLEKISNIFKTNYRHNDNTQKDRKILCLYCDRTFTNQKLYFKHSRRVHLISSVRRNSKRSLNAANSEFFGCSFCRNDKSTCYADDLNSLFNHLVNDHSDKYFACSLCIIKFQNKELLNIHNRNEHKEIHDLLQLSQITQQRQLSISKINSTSTTTTTTTTTTVTRTTRRSASVKDNLLQYATQTRSSRYRRENINYNMKSQSNTKNSIYMNTVEPMLSRLGIAQNRCPCNKRGNSQNSANSNILGFDNNLSYGNNSVNRKNSNELKLMEVNNKNGKPNTLPNFDGADNFNSSKCNFIFDDAFYENVTHNVNLNMACYLDGKIQSDTSPNPNTSTEGTDSNTKMQRQLFEATKLNTSSTFPTLLTNDQFGTNANKQNKTKKPITKNSWKWKWDSVKKYKYVNEGGKIVKKIKAPCYGLRDLSELDMWTQLSMRARYENSQSAISDAKSDEIKVIQQLNRILSTRHIPQIDLEQLDASVIKQEENIIEVVQDVIVDNVIENTVEIDFLQMMNLKRMNNTISSAKTISNINHNKLVLSGEWARPRCYICYECGYKLNTLKCIKEHIILRHPNVNTFYYEIVGRELMEGHLYNHYYIPSNALYMNYKYVRNNFSLNVTTGILRTSRIHENMRSSSSSSSLSSVSSSCSSQATSSIVPLSSVGRSQVTETRRSVSERSKCTKCKKIFSTHVDLYRHILDCSGDYVWSQAKKKLRYRRSKRKRYNRGMGRKAKAVSSPNSSDSNNPNSPVKDEESLDAILNTEISSTSGEHSLLFPESLPENYERVDKKILRSSSTSNSETKSSNTSEIDKINCKKSRLKNDNMFISSKAFKNNSSRIKLNKPRRNNLTARILRSNARKTRTRANSSYSLDKRKISLRKPKIKKSHESTRSSVKEDNEELSIVSIQVDDAAQEESKAELSSVSEIKDDIEAPKEAVPCEPEVEKLKEKEIETTFETNSQQKEIQSLCNKRKPKKINDCINMLTGKLQEKFGINFFDNTFLPLPYVPTITMQSDELEIKKMVSTEEVNLKIEKSTIPIDSIPETLPVHTLNIMEALALQPKVKRQPIAATEVLAVKALVTPMEDSSQLKINEITKSLTEINETGIEETLKINGDIKESAKIGTQIEETMKIETTKMETVKQETELKDIKEKEAQAIQTDKKEPKITETAALPINALDEATENAKSSIIFEVCSTELHVNNENLNVPIASMCENVKPPEIIDGPSYKKSKVEGSIVDPIVLETTSLVEVMLNNDPPPVTLCSDSVPTNGVVSAKSTKSEDIPNKVSNCVKNPTSLVREPISNENNYSDDFTNQSEKVQNKVKSNKKRINDIFRNNKIKSNNFKNMGGENNDKITRKSVRLQQNILIQNDKDSNKNIVINSSQASDNCPKINTEIEIEKDNNDFENNKDVKIWTESLPNNGTSDEIKKFPRIVNKLDNDSNSENMFFNDEDSQLQFKVNNDVINNFIIGESDEEDAESVELLNSDSMMVNNKKTLKDVGNCKNLILNNTNNLKDEAASINSDLITKRTNCKIVNVKSDILNEKNKINSISNIKKKKHKRSILLKKSRKNNYLKLLVNNKIEEEIGNDFSCKLCMKSFKKIEALNRHKTTFKHITNLSKQEFLDFEGKKFNDNEDNNCGNMKPKEINVKECVETSRADVISGTETTNENTPVHANAEEVIWEHDEKLINNASSIILDEEMLPLNEAEPIPVQSMMIPIEINTINTDEQMQKEVEQVQEEPVIEIADNFHQDENNLIPVENKLIAEQPPLIQNDNDEVDDLVNNDLITMSLSKDEKFFFECCSMLKESVGRTFDTNYTTTTTVLSTTLNCQNPILQSAPVEKFTDDFDEKKVSDAVVDQYEDTTILNNASKENSMSNISDCSKQFNIRTKGALKGYDFKVSIPTICLNLNKTLCNKNMNNNTNDLNRCIVQKKCDKELGLRKLVTRNNANLNKDKYIEQNNVGSTVSSNESEYNTDDGSCVKGTQTNNTVKMSKSSLNDKVMLLNNQSEIIALNNEKNDDTVLSGTSFSDRLESLSVVETSSFDDDHTISSNTNNSMPTNKIYEKNNFTQNKSLIMEKIFKRKDPANHNTANDIAHGAQVSTKNIHIAKNEGQVNFDKLFDKLKKNDIISQARANSNTNSNDFKSNINIIENNEKNLKSTNNKKRKRSISFRRSTAMPKKKNNYTNNRVSSKNIETDMNLLDTNNENLIEKQLQVTSSNQRKIKQVELIEAELNMSIEEIEEIIGIGRRKSKRRCASGKPKILAETWSSDEYEDFHSAHDIITLMQKNEKDIMKSSVSEKEDKMSRIGLCKVENVKPIEPEVPANVSKKKVMISRKKNIKSVINDISCNPGIKFKAKKKKSDRVKKVKNMAYDSDSDFELNLSKSRVRNFDPKSKSVLQKCAENKSRVCNNTYSDNKSEKSKSEKFENKTNEDYRVSANNTTSTTTMSTNDNVYNINDPKRKRTATEMLYYWSSSESEDEYGKTSQSVSNCHKHEDEHFVQQHGWIVGDSHKRIVTLLAHTKGKKIDECSVVKKRK